MVWIWNKRNGCGTEMKAIKMKDKRKSETPSNCPNCGKWVCRYEDAVADRTHRLKMISDLCLGATLPDLITPVLTQEIGHAIQEALTADAIARWYCLRRDPSLLARWGLLKNDTEVKAEVLKMKNTFSNGDEE